MFLSKDVILLPESSAAQPDRWLAMNVFARTSVGVSSDVVRLLGNLESVTDTEKKYVCWNVQRFSNEDGLLADPSRFVRDGTKWEEIVLSHDGLIPLLLKHFILVEDEDAYRSRFQPKRNLLDRERFGNFHQQHGQHLLTVKRTDPADWWMRQKFTDDLRNVRGDTLYGAVQWKFLERFFAERMRPGLRVLDLGCGTGIYSNEMAKHGATVLGVDPSEEYLAVARKYAIDGTSFERMDVGKPKSLASIADGSIDFIFMSDALLFYFQNFLAGDKPEIDHLLSEVKRVLHPQGSFFTVEPHGVFYLTPWLGSRDRPFTVVTEYLHKHFGVVPSLSRFFEPLKRFGFAVVDLLEIEPDEYFRQVDDRGYHFAKEFPQWQIVELKQIKSNEPR